MELTEQEQAERQDAIDANMRAQGIEPFEPVQADYFGFDETLRVVLPDGRSFIEHRVLNEGQRRKYLNAVNRDVRIHRGTGDAVMKTAPGDERKELLKAAISGWNLMRAGSPIAFTPKALDDFLDRADPRIVDLIEKEVRKANPWLLADMTLEDIDREMANLQEMRDRKAAEEEGKLVSSSR